MQLLSQAIYSILSSDAAITDITGTGNIWHAKIPQRTLDGSDAPQSISVYFYVYAIDPTGATKQGMAETDAHMVRVCILGKDDDDMYQVAQYIRYALDRVTPGTYGGIVIDGSKFVNASFEPEGNYELELQQWTLEFQFRVIDNYIRTGTPTPGSGDSTVTMVNTIKRQKITLTYKDFQYGDVTNVIELGFTLPAKGVLRSITMQPTIYFAGNGITDYTIQVGDFTHTDKYIFEQSVYTDAPLPESIMTGGTIESMTDPTVFAVRATSVGNDLSFATSGKVSFWISYEILN